jgi:hypothetical protein
VFEKSRHPNGYNNIRDRVCIEYKSGNKSSVKTIYFDTYDEATAYREKLAFEVNNRNKKEANDTELDNSIEYLSYFDATKFYEEYKAWSKPILEKSISDAMERLSKQYNFKQN